MCLWQKLNRCATAEWDERRIFSQLVLIQNGYLSLWQYEPVGAKPQSSESVTIQCVRRKSKTHIALYCHVQVVERYEEVNKCGCVLGLQLGL